MTERLVKVPESIVRRAADRLQEEANSIKDGATVKGKWTSSMGDPEGDGARADHLDAVILADALRWALAQEP